MSTETRPAAFLISGRYGWCHYCDYLGLELIWWIRFGVVVFGSVFGTKSTRKKRLEAEQWTPFWEGKTACFRRCRWKLFYYIGNFNKNSQESALTRLSSSFSWIFLKMGPVPAFHWSFPLKTDGLELETRGVSLEKKAVTRTWKPQQSSAYSLLIFGGARVVVYTW